MLQATLRAGFRPDTLSGVSVPHTGKRLCNLVDKAQRQAWHELKDSNPPLGFWRPRSFPLNEARLEVAGN